MNHQALHCSDAFFRAPLQVIGSFPASPAALAHASQRTGLQVLRTLDKISQSASRRSKELKSKCASCVEVTHSHLRQHHTHLRQHHTHAAANGAAVRQKSCRFLVSSVTAVSGPSPSDLVGLQDLQDSFDARRYLPTLLLAVRSGEPKPMLFAIDALTKLMAQSFTNPEVDVIGDLDTRMVDGALSSAMTH